MTRQEVAKLMYAIRALYTTHFRNFTDDQYRAQVEAWAVVFADVAYSEAQIGLKLYAMKDEGFPPTPGQLRRCVEEARRKKEIADTLRDMGLSDQIEYNVGSDFVQVALINTRG